MKFREFVTNSGRKVLAGKDAESNEILVKQFAGKGNKIFHTAASGSPFCVIENLKPDKKDIAETAAFCALKSQDWRDNKGDVIVHYFTGRDIYKRKGMKLGTFGIKKFKIIKVKKGEIEKLKRKQRTP